MSSINTIPSEKLARLVGTPKCPAIVDVRLEEEFDRDPRLIPGSLRRRHDATTDWAKEFAGRPVVVLCHKGLKISEGVAALLRCAGVAAEILEDGFAGWEKARLPLVPAEKIPRRDGLGRTLWVTRSRPKIDRIACPWLIRRFVDPAAAFLFVAPAQVVATASHFGAVAFDVEDVFWSHRGEACTFDVMIEEFALSSPALNRLGTIVRGADTARLDLAPESAGLLAVSLGLSRMHADDLVQLETGIDLYDALYRWCRDAVDETHNWPVRKASV